MLQLCLFIEGLPMAGRNKKFTKYKKTRFCRILAMTGSKLKACQAVGISFPTFSKYYKLDTEFASLVDEAVMEATEVAEDELWRRGVEGIDVVVGYTKDGQPIIERKYSDRLLTMIVKAGKPEKYSDKSQVQHTGAIEHKIEADVKDKLLEKFHKMIDVTPAKPVLEDQRTPFTIEMEPQSVPSEYSNIKSE